MGLEDLVRVAAKVVIEMKKGVPKAIPEKAKVAKVDMETTKGTRGASVAMTMVVVGVAVMMVVGMLGADNQKHMLILQLQIQAVELQQVSNQRVLAEGVKQNDGECWLR